MARQYTDAGEHRSAYDGYAERRRPNIRSIFDTSESDLSQLNEDFPKQISEELPASLNIKKAGSNATAEDLTIDKPYNEMVDDFERKYSQQHWRKQKVMFQRQAAY